MEGEISLFVMQWYNKLILKRFLITMMPVSPGAMLSFPTVMFTEAADAWPSEYLLKCCDFS